jgi:hypothetical protein
LLKRLEQEKVLYHGLRMDTVIFNYQHYTELLKLDLGKELT